jgi:hypothetical protein
MIDKLINLLIDHNVYWRVKYFRQLTGVPNFFVSQSSVPGTSRFIGISVAAGSGWQIAGHPKTPRGGSGFSLTCIMSG